MEDDSLPIDRCPPTIVHRPLLASRYRWELLGLLFLAFFFHQGDRAIFGVVLPAIKTDLQLTDAQLGIVGSVLFATLAVLMPITGYLGDIWSRKWIITVSLLFWSFATLVTGMARGMIGLVAYRSVATAGGEAFYAPAAYSLLGQFHQKTRALAMSVHQCAVYLGVIASGYLGGYIAEQWGWRSAFYMFGGGGILLGILFCFRLKDSPRASTPHDDRIGARVGPVEALGVLFRTPTAVLITLAFTGYVFVNNAYLVWAPTFVGEKFHLSLGAAGGCSMLYYFLAATIGVLIGGRVSDAVVTSRRQFRLEFQIIVLFLGVPAILSMGFAGNLTATLAAMVGAGMSNGLYSSNIHAALFDVIAPRYRASAVAMMTTVAFLIGSTSPWLLGCCCTWFTNGNGLSYGFAALSAGYFAGGLALLAALKHTFHRDFYAETPVAPNVLL
jgi:MFS transporter, Spinster family, sphingosine-1-phosphate transporter